MAAKEPEIESYAFLNRIFLKVVKLRTAKVNINQLFAKKSILKQSQKFCLNNQVGILQLIFCMFFRQKMNEF